MNKINFFAAGILLLIISCKNSNEPTPVNKEPSASINIESTSETLWNEVKVTVNATDADGNIASVELYADDEWIGSDAEAPYEFTWNTKDFEDGEIELKAKVTDDLEAFAESTKTVEVMNTLINYDLYDGYLDMSPDYKYFTYITSKSKQILHFEQIETLPYKVKVVRPDDFNDAEFDIHFVWANPTEGHLITYNDFTPGIFAPVNPDHKGSKVGETNMTFTDIPEHDYYTFAKNAGGLLETGTPYHALVYENLNLGYLYLRNGSQGLYKVITGMTDGDAVTSLSATGFEMQEHTLTIKDDLTQFEIYVNGHIDSEADAPGIRLFGHFKSGDLNGYEISYHTPDKEAAFDHYSNSLSLFYPDGKFYMNESYFDIITTPIMPNINFTLGNNTLSDIDLIVTGDDYDVLTGYYYTAHDGFKFYWETYSADEDLEFPVIPNQLTSAFTKFSNSNLIFKEAIVNFLAEDFDHLNNYNAYRETLAGRTGKTLKEGGSYSTKVGQIF